MRSKLTMDKIDFQHFNEIDHISTIPFLLENDGERPYNDFTFHIPSSVISSMHAFIQKGNISYESFFYGVLGMLLQRYNFQKTVVFGTSTIPYMFTYSEKESVLQMFQRVDREIKQLHDHTLAQNLLMDEQSIDPLYKVNIDCRETEKPHQNVVKTMMEERGLDVFIEIAGPNWNELTIYGKFERKMANTLFSHYFQMMKNILQAEQEAPSEVEMISEDEKRLIFSKFNKTSTQSNWNLPVHQIFESIAELSPNQPALVHHSQQLSYSELNERANQLARLLIKKGVCEETIVSILLKPSIDLFVAILGVLKAGGAYLPIDPEYPVSRIQYIIEDSQTPLLITDSEMKILNPFPIETVFIDDRTIYDHIDSTNVDIEKNLDELAYVIYTSGSTGNPKGVMVEHQALLNLCEWHIEYYSVTKNDRASKLAGIGFDASVWEIFPYLLCGATIYIVPDDIRIDPIRLNQYFEENGITISFLPTPLCEPFLKLKNTSLRYLLTGGDKLKQFVPNSYTLVNNYGPTENTVVSTAFPVNEYEQNIPIGKPISNVHAYIIDQFGNLQPIGVPGELCLSGKNIARGYLGKEKLTKEKFIDHPFEPNMKLYRTGDLAKWLPSGDLQFLGRIDQQVKIRGYRIELGEIESQLLQHEEIHDAVVVDYEDEYGLKFLVAYFVGKKGIEKMELKQFLASSLPEYMIPSQFIQVDTLPLTQNGKVDRKALPNPTTESEKIFYAPPTNATERKLAEIWKETLHLSKVGITDDFFELGGHSIKAAVVKSAIYQQFGIDLPITELFTHSTIEQLANVISSYEPSQETTRTRIPLAQRKEVYPLVPAQKRLFFLEQQNDIGISYNEPFIQLIEGQLNIEQLQNSFDQLVKRHDALRTSFVWQENEPVQIIHDKVDYRFEMIEKGKDSIEDVIHSFIRPFDLSEAPLFRVGLIHVEEEKYVFILDIHHLIVDGSSMSILTKEWSALYRGEQLPSKRIDYRDYSEWQSQFLSSLQYRDQETFWLKKYEGELPVTNLPLDFARPSIQKHEGGRVHFTIDPLLTKELKSLARQRNSTLYMTMLAGFSILISKYTSQDDLVIGTPVTGRNHSDLDEMVGMFVNTLAIRLQPQSHKSVNRYIDEVRQEVLEAFDHQDYQFDDLVKNLGIRRDLSRNPLFDVLFVLQNTDEATFDFGPIKTTDLPFDKGTSKFDLTIEAREKNSTIELAIEYRTSLFRNDTMVRFAQHYQNVLKEMTMKRNETIGTLAILSSEEREQIIEQFNRSYRQIDQQKSIIDLFEDVCETFPQKKAVIHNDSSVTYDQLNRKANQIARKLLDANLKQNAIVGVMMDRSLDYIATILGIMKAKAAFLPLDPEYPVERLKYMLEDSNTTLLLTKKTFAQKLAFKGTTLFVDDDLNLFSDANVKLNRSSSDLAYIIYTSGSTGRPKGVMLEHKGIVNLQPFFQEKLKVTEKDQIVQFASISFDASVWEIFMSLLNGATLHIVTKEIINDYQAFENYLNEQNISIMTGPPAYITYLEPKRIHSLKRIVVAGSASPPELVKKWSKKVEYINAYGPTEATICATTWNSSERTPFFQSVPIGKPVYNTEIAILSKDKQLQPIGVAGELCISGIGLARGYLHREELTKEKFIPHPYKSDQTIYRTGDLARWLPDGNIEFLGRIDHQVKIRGFRVELGEIENELLRHPAVKESFVIDHKDRHGQSFLAAYLVMKQNIETNELKTHLAKQLPDYMIPSFFVYMDELPLTPNGKVDRKALPKPDIQIRERTDYTPPRNETEQMLCELWQDILSIEQVGIHDNFFELGGDSIKVAVMVSKMQHRYPVTINQVYENQTIAELAEKLSDSKTNPLRTIERLKRKLTEKKETNEQLIAIQQENYVSSIDAFEGIDLQRKNHYQHILLTGSTGYLGVHILEQLLKNDRSTIYLLIRGNTEEEARQRLRKKLIFSFETDLLSDYRNRIVILPGDLLQPRFGLDEAIYNELSEKIEAIIHCAANVKHYGFYSDFYQSNVVATESLLQFAKLNQFKDFHHISTTSVANGVVKGKDDLLFTEFDLDIGQNITNYYAKSKFEAEKLVAQARKDGLKCNIYRFGNISFHSQTGKFQENVEDNAFYSLLKGYMQLGIVPTDLQTFDITNVDFVSKAFHLLMNCENLNNEVFHLFNHHFVQLENLLTMKELYTNVKPVSVSEFVERVVQMNGDVRYEEAIDQILLHSGWLSENAETQFHLASDKTAFLLQKLGFEWLPIDKEMFIRMFKYGRDIQFFE
ncbi:non-ribosomal peptide synthetase [Fervidibacillus albus]|uniref:Amino acid adenylation domain-containing protein n=1 Tax=Fervidibacillus albus TaxID=2980026 RepID=A0A9E8RY57_9BACI|nr:non-ribosomal peptide synthetase [Fervidibacillus albus]WAA10277.1 amino acid adenylation domain-containing protein [Fervidibacillus albus]